MIVASSKDSSAQHAACMDIHLLSRSERADAARTWVLLEQRYGTGKLACSWDWTETWLHHYGSRVAHWFAVAERDGTPCGIALITRGAFWPLGPNGIGSIHIGTAGEPRGETVTVEYNRLLVAPEDRDAFAAALIAAIRRYRFSFMFRLDGFDPEDAQAMLHAEPGFAPEYHANPTFDLDSARRGGQTVLDALRPSPRRNIRRSVRLLGELQTEWAASPGEGLAILDELIELHQRRWQRSGRRGSFASARFTGFHRDLIPRLMAREEAILFRVRNDEGTVGCLYCFVDEGSVLFYQSGFRHVTDNRIKPGLVTHALCMQACLERGYRNYDFLMGEQRYKRELATTERTLVTATAYRYPILVPVADALQRLQVIDAARRLMLLRERVAVTRENAMEPAARARDASATNRHA